MINVEQVTVDLRMPTDSVAIVAMQPFIELDVAVAPFTWRADKVKKQLDSIRRTLALAEGGLEGKAVSFTLFPEYAIPGLDGVTMINERLALDTFPNDSMVIGGVHGLTKVEYANLCEVLEAEVADGNLPAAVPNNRWVNCCVIWTKDRNGDLRAWIQPKVRRAWLEAQVPDNDMFAGKSIYVFRCGYINHNTPCNIASFICSDWSEKRDNTTISADVLTQLNAQVQGDFTAIDWAFVIQLNPEPNHHIFLESTNRFLADNTLATQVIREKAVVVQANVAISDVPVNGRKPANKENRGFSSCTFAPNAPFDCKGSRPRPTVNMQTKQLRGSNYLDEHRCPDVVFREMGECIHRFNVRVPRFVTANAADHTYPIPTAEVHAISDDLDDPRLPGGPVSASLKWLNDSLDEVDSLSTTDLAGTDLSSAAADRQSEVVSEMRTLDGPAASDCTNLATCSQSSQKVSRDAKRQVDADLWDRVELDALQHVVNSLTSIAMVYDLDASNTAQLHGVVKDDARLFQIVAIRGDSHEDCHRHFNEFVVDKDNGNDPIMLISRDRSNSKPLEKDFVKFYGGDEDEGIKYLDYQTLLQCCQNSPAPDVLRDCLDEFLPNDRKII